jgi:hypothetical protein
MVLEMHSLTQFRPGIEIVVICVGIVLFLRMRAKERKSHGDLADAKIGDLPIVLKGSRPPLVVLVIGVVLFALMGVVFGVAACAIFPDWLTLVLVVASLAVFGFSAVGIMGIIRPKPFKIITISTKGIAIQGIRSNTGEYAWQDIIGISNGVGPGTIIANDWLTLYVSPEVALRRIAAKSYSMNPNLVYLTHVQGFSGWDLSPFAKLIDKYRQICTGLPPLYKS